MYNDCLVIYHFENQGSVYMCWTLYPHIMWRTRNGTTHYDDPVCRATCNNTKYEKIHVMKIRPQQKSIHFQDLMECHAQFKGVVKWSLHQTGKNPVENLTAPHCQWGAVQFSLLRVHRFSLCVKWLDLLKFSLSCGQFNSHLRTASNLLKCVN